MASILLKIGRICNSPCKCIDLKKAKYFLNCLFHFWNLHQIFNILKKIMMVIAIVFQKLQNLKNFVRPLCKKRYFVTRFDSQHVKMSQILEKSPWEHFYHVFSSFWGMLIWKMSPLVVGEILGGFVNTLTADGKYHVQDWENFPLPIQMLNEKRKSFSQFFVPFLESTPNFKKFEKKYDGHS